MTGTKLSTQQAAQTMRERYGEDYFKKIGYKGGKKKTNPRQYRRRNGRFGKLR